MASLPSNTSGPSRKSVAQAQADMQRELYDFSEKFNEYYVDDEDGNIDRSDRPPVTSSIATGTKKKLPRQPRKAPTTPTMPPKKAQEVSPPSRKSTRIAKKRAFAQDSDEAVENTQPAEKKLKKTTGAAASRKRASKPIKEAAPVPDVPIADEVNADGADDVTEHPDAEDDAPVAQSKAKSFKGKATTMGTSDAKPEDAPNDQPWHCANRNCSSGQTWHNRDGSNSFGRKVISNFFGRNKKETNLIDNNVWHNYCRKDYQRATYRASIQSDEAKCNYYIDNIEMQLVRLQLWRPDAKFQVQLSKGAKTRLGQYYKELSKNGGNKAKAAKSVQKTAEIGTKGKKKPLSLEDGFPIEHMKHFDDNFCGEDYDYDGLTSIVDWIKTLVENGKITSMPPMEFLINKQAQGEQVVDPTDNYDRWAEYEDEQSRILERFEAGDERAAEESSEENELGAISTKPTEAAEDSEATEPNSDASDNDAGKAIDEGLADAGSDDEVESDVEPLTPPPPKFKVRPTKPYTPYQTTTRVISGVEALYAEKRKRDAEREAQRYSDEADDEATSTPSKKRKLGPS
ncbi:hypothetical protein LTR37_011822 [Vermiconidia calcicola]|uniref:Uncharacterized protein n=1 Tax=Vermiconidia calcicola TaxID=1690605 RepID=A0ACC3N179_9PEZI|nr:hypothetical protein LTR37_011822 [Vermiconidia calcicola]